MNREIMISLTSVQWQDNEKSETELLTKAKLVHENGWDIISYEDSSATGFEGSVTPKDRQGKNGFNYPQGNG